VGPEDEHLSYTYPVETPDGELLLFYRMGPATGNSPLVVSRSGDLGATWKDPRVLVDYGFNEGAGTVKIRDAVYSVKTGRVHLSIFERDNSSESVKWHAHYCEYDPDADRMFALNGKDLGKTASRESLVENDCRRPSGGDLMVWNGKAYLLMGRTLGVVTDGLLKTRRLPEAVHGGRPSILYIAAEDDWRIYGWHHEVITPYPSDGDVVLWQSSDGGKTWEKGRVLLRCTDLTHGLTSMNLVRQPPTMNKAYTGSGPMLLVQEDWSASHGKELRGEGGSTFSDMQPRFNKRIYALDGNHDFVTRGTPYKFVGYWDDREGRPAGQGPGPWSPKFQLR
jgi:hypothetical protein